MKLMVINPNTTTSMTDAVVAAARTVARPDTTIVGGTPADGVAGVESHYEEAWGALGVIDQVRKGEEQGIDGYVVACFGDTGVPAARELANGPVVGMTEAALMTAALIAHRFTIVTLPRRTIAHSERVVQALGLGHRCTVRAVDVPVADLAEGSAHLAEVFAAEARREPDAEALILGCAGLTDLVGPLTARLGMPVIDGVTAAVPMVEGLIAQGLTASRVNTWRHP
ncbi:aspartate/glutamate racemase family protein [Paractinoplanes durhamensis]|uniref:Asp/Glu racemase n=1 Tax=Paractinoplanes durhamensis TaxID=113563 RepID=A0ABQ3YVD8_9ACTN|nr:aspartate/glutamate racemase family protein [Actinoplanes durhamensis]GIE01492.1 Asp/Glu racemase [Actinoplanes durhamensis]